MREVSHSENFVVKLFLLRSKNEPKSFVSEDDSKYFEP